MVIEPGQWRSSRYVSELYKQPRLHTQRNFTLAIAYDGNKGKGGKEKW